jgi:hypothetical protein
MPRYFFHIREEDHIILDTDGAVLPDLNTAREEAVAAAREVLADMMRKTLSGQELIICDDRGDELCTIPFSSTFRLQ